MAPDLSWNAHPRSAPRRPAAGPPLGGPQRPVEFWSTGAIRSALLSGDIATWQQIATALKRDPYGRTARQVEEILNAAGHRGINNALQEVLDRARAHLDADERGEVARHVRLLLDRSRLTPQEFASRIGIPAALLGDYLNARINPPASMMVRMRRLSDRFVKQRAGHSG